MRIVGGVHRGRRLVAPPGDTVRPTSDRAREALFNILSHGDFAASGLNFAERAVLDAFAGTGAFGLEALSRGAGAAVFIEKDREALAVLRRNVAALGEAGRAQIVAGDATRPPRAGLACALALLDPPYRSGLAAPALAALAASGWLTPDALIVIEVGAREDLPAVAGFTLLDERVYGAARLVFLRREFPGGERPPNRRPVMTETLPKELPRVTLPDGESVPAFGLGTWHMGEDRRRAADEEAALKLGIELGMTLIDTAEMYGNGTAEEIVARAAAGLRERLFIVSKVLPYNASQQGVIDACERSLRRLKTDHIDLYLLHWRGSVPLAETLAGFARLQRDGKIRHHGVSNFNIDDMQEWVGLAGGEKIAANQILYNLGRRGPEYEVIPWCRERAISIMAYTPLEQGRILGNRALGEVAARHRASAAQVALAWLLRQDGMIVIPKATTLDHVRDNRGALDLKLDADDLAALDRAFPPPRGRSALGML